MKLTDLTYKPRQATIRIVFDDELRRNVDAVRSRLARQKAEEAKDGQGLGSELPALVEQLAEAERMADEAAVAFTFKALPRHEIAGLVAACPPSADALTKWREEVKASPLIARPAPEFDWDQFAPRLIAKAMVEPGTSVEEVLGLWESGEWGEAVWVELWKAAWSVNQEVSTRPTFGTDSKPT